MIGPLGGPWLLLAGLLCVAVLCRRLPAPDRGDLVIACGLAVGATLARLLLGAWLPLHVNGQGPLWVQGALAPAVLAGSYGPGYFELLGWAAAASPNPERAVFAANALLSGLSPALLYAAARLAGVERGGALAAALILAADAVIVRSAASESYFAPLIALVLAVQVALAAGMRAQLRSDWTGAGLALAAAGLLAAAAARVHPSGYLPLALSPLIVLSSAQPERWAARLLRVAVAAAGIGAVVVLTSGSAVVTALRAPFADQAIGGAAPGAWPVALIGLPLAVLLHYWAKPPWLPLLAVASAFDMLATRASFQQHPLWTLAYERLFWPGMLLGAAALFPRRLHHPAWALAAAAAVAALALRAALPHLATPTTEQLEYRFLRDSLAAMNDCTVAGVSRAGRRQWAIPSFLAPGHSAQRSVQSAADLAGAPGACLLYVRGSICSSAEARSLCESVEREARLERVDSRVFPALPSYDGLPYDRDEVETVVFRVIGHRPGVSDGAAITPAFAQALYDRVMPMQEADGCRPLRVDTSRFRIAVTLRDRAGTEHPIELATTATGRGAAPWQSVAAAEAQRQCPQSLAALQRLLAELGTPDAAEVTQPTG